MSKDVEYNYTPANQCFAGEHKTNFAALNMKTMKAMVSASNPDEVKNCSKGWADVYTQLVGGEASSGSGGGGGILKVFTSAVDEVLQHWEGEAAQRFKAEADKIAKKIKDGAEYARYTSIAMGNAANVLAQLKPEIEAMEMPDKVDSGLDWLGDMGSRSDAKLKEDLANGVDTQQALDNNRGELSAGKEAQLEMAVKMEQLGAAYVAQSKAMGTWQRRPKPKDNDENYPGEPGGTAPVPMPVGESPTAPAPQNRGPLTAAPKGPGVDSKMLSPEPGIHGGTNTGTVSPNVPSGATIDTNLDGTSTPVKASPTTPSPVTPTGGPHGLPPGTPPSGGGPAHVPPVPFANQLGRSVSGTPTGTPTNGRPPLRGAPITGGMQQDGTKKPGMGRGPLATTPGGVVGANPKSASKNQGGSGLHRSRGGSMSGQAGLAGRRGMMAVPPNRTAKGEEEGQKGKRPDYLVEDEETWMPEREVAPKVVE